ncbi:MAG: bifunctional phosphopantothenoylcysteine decarboxylase/phosphopantothenate--cysteine ligase CoaBC [Gammaproteobacteria bacterium]|nr:bifunctional phosphopantothenoylcysteine decarboxylase/phosphopantothenate--cysteine ligase CoaBC [Gammaproteobacteria bacterium]
MALLPNKRVLLGVSGGIAAYKSPDLVRRLREAGAEVRVLMTRAAMEFVTPLTFQAVSGHPVYSELLDEKAEAGMGHIELARWADLVLVAPATADTLARLAQGRADDLLAAACLARRGILAVAPAMNQAMWENPATRGNLRALESAGVTILGPGHGSQACGDEGAGRMLEPAEIAQRAAALFETGGLAGRHVVITAGPTFEPIDPVRGLTNRSSGTMGFAIAEAAVEAGARVTLVSGPVALAAPQRVDCLVRVETAMQMRDAVMAHMPDCDVFIAVAAVADYRPARALPRKIKKDAEQLSLELVRNPDIVAEVAALPRRPFTVGFAAETDQLEQNAQAKLVAKGLDLICANPVGPDTGFGDGATSLLLIDAQGQHPLPLDSKPRLARALVDYLARRLHEKEDSAQDPRSAHRQ